MSHGAIPAAAAVINVTTTTDGGPGSLRAAFDTANGNGQDDEIVLAAGATYDLTVCGGATEEDANANGDLDYTEANNLAITGNGSTIRNSCLDERVIELLGGAGAIALSGLTVTGGHTSEDGGGIRTADSSVTVVDGFFTLNTAAQNGGGISSTTADVSVIRSSFSSNSAAGVTGDGGGIRVTEARVIIADSSFTENSAGQDGGGVRVTSSPAITITGSTFAGNDAGVDGGALETVSGAVSLENTTISGNTAGSDGGGIRNNAGSIVANNTTFHGNDAIGGGGDALMIFSESGSVHLSNSILAAPGPDACGGAGTVTSDGHNLSTDATCNLTGPGDKPNTDPKLGPLDDHGGPTQTHALPKGSPAIDAGDPATPGSGGTSCEATDQRGLSRNCDIGAYELTFCGKAVVNGIGTPGNDVLTGTGQADGFLGLQGHDVLNGKRGKDGLCGGPGRDKLKGGGGKDVLKGQGGKDVCIGQGGKDKARACEKEKTVP